MMNGERLNLVTTSRFWGLVVIAFLFSKDHSVDETQGNSDRRLEETREETKIRIVADACFHGHLRHWIESCSGSQDSGFATTSQRLHGAAGYANACASNKSNRQPAGCNNSNPDSNATTDASPNASR